MSQQSRVVNALRCGPRELRSAYHLLGFITLVLLGPGGGGGSLNSPIRCLHGPNGALLDPLPHVRFGSIAVATISLWDVVIVYHLLFLLPLTEDHRGHLNFS